MSFGLLDECLDVASEHDCELVERADSLVFVGPQGGPVQYSHFRSKVWVPACLQAGVPGAQPHDLRRANATAMVHSGVDVKTMQTRLGQTDLRLAIAIYAQKTTAADMDAAERLGDVLRLRRPRIVQIRARSRVAYARNSRDRTRNRALTAALRRAPRAPDQHFRRWR